MSNRKNKRDETPEPGDVPRAVVNRLSLYLRELQHLMAEGTHTISSGELGERLNFSDAQVRKDLAYFGHFGYPGIGYRADELIGAIKKILGTDRAWPVALIGIGNLGRALLGYKGFSRQGFDIVAAFDADPTKVGIVVEGIQVRDIASLAEAVSQQRVRLGMIAVPAPAAQSVADLLVGAGIEGIVNFAPVTIALPPNVSQLGVDLAIELEQITFDVVNRLRTR